MSRAPFGGKGGKTFDTYLDVVSAYTVPEDKAFCPFTFPLQFAKAMASGNEDMLVSDGSYKRDLSLFRSEVGKPIVLLFDEGNVLANSRSLLEKLRNTFMNTAGFMLVLTGTPDLFPIVDEVFSPIVRQFKKINVGEFKDQDETSACIRKPLEKIGLKPEDIFDFDTIKEVVEIHNLSSGRPYEIQLICFMMFKRVQERRASRMKLDLSILEEVREELETSQDITTRPVLTSIRSLSERQLRALSLLSSCNGYATFEQIWSIEYIFNGERLWKNAELRDELSHLVSKGIFWLDDDNIIRFTGDDFDKIYTKYFASEQGMLIDIREEALEFYWYIRLHTYLSTFTGLRLAPEITPRSQTIDLEELGSGLASTNSDVDIFVDDRFILRTLYQLMIAYHDAETLPLVQVLLSLSPVNAQVTYFSSRVDQVGSIDRSVGESDLLTARCAEFGGSLTFKKVVLPVVPIEVLAQKVDRTANENLRVSLAYHHISAMEEEYVRRNRKDEAFMHAKLALRYNPDPPVYSENNLGYVMMSQGEHATARSLFETHSAKSEGFEKALSTYNLGVVEIMLGNLSKGIELIKAAEELSASINGRARECACLFLPTVDDGRLIFREEERAVDLHVIASTAHNNLRNLEEVELN